MNSTLIVMLLAFGITSIVSFQSSSAQTDNGNATTGQEVITSNGTFASSLDLFVVPESVGGYGVYRIHLRLVRI
jgi:hypothetical protein